MADGEWNFLGDTGPLHIAGPRNQFLQIIANAISREQLMRVHPCISLTFKAIRPFRFLTVLDVVPKVGPYKKGHRG